MRGTKTEAILLQLEYQLYTHSNKKGNESYRHLVNGFEITGVCYIRGQLRSHVDSCKGLDNIFLWNFQRHDIITSFNPKVYTEIVRNFDRMSEWRSGFRNSDVYYFVNMYPTHLRSKHVYQTLWHLGEKVLYNYPNNVYTSLFQSRVTLAGSTVGGV